MDSTFTQIKNYLKFEEKNNFLSKEILINGKLNSIREDLFRPLGNWRDETCVRDCTCTTLMMMGEGEGGALVSGMASKRAGSEHET